MVWEEHEQRIEFLENQLKVAMERIVRYEAMFEVQTAFFGSLVENHEDRESLLKTFERASAIPLANNSIHAGDDLTAMVKDEETKFQVQNYLTLLGAG